MSFHQASYRQFVKLTNDYSYLKADNEQLIKRDKNMAGILRNMEKNILL